MLSVFMLSGIFIIQRLRNDQYVYQPLMFGMTTYYLFGFIDLGDEFFPPQQWFIVLENLCAAIGPIFLIIGFYRWTEVRRKQINVLEQRTAQIKKQNENLDRFSSVVAHDLRNPLNVIEGRAGLLREERDDPQIDAILQACSRMNDLIENLLSLARSGKTVETIEQRNLNTLANQAWASIEAPDASLEISSDTSIICDAARIQQLLENLFRNAVEHGGTDVTIRVGSLETGFYVENTGKGIPEEARDQVFEEAYSTGGAAGLGLSIVREIAEAHGWTVNLTASPEGGARFEFTNVDTQIG